MAKVIFKNGTTKNFRITLKDVGGYARSWHHIEYADFKRAAAKILQVDINTIDRAYL